MKWITNISKVETATVMNANKSYADAQIRLELLKDKIVGKPHATKRYTVKELEDLGMVGLYTK